MATILNDIELKRLIGSVIVNGDEKCVRSNSYILRLGAHGEFTNTEKEFDISGTEKRGIKIPPGYGVGVTSFETLDFTRETVHKFYPNCDLHAFISPTTDLSRESISTQTTQVDAGYCGTPQWTLQNNSNQTRQFTYKEKIFRITILKLTEGETPDSVYGGGYQRQTGYVRSERAGAPVGMRESHWVDPMKDGGPEDLLDSLINTGHPWNILGQRLRSIDTQFNEVMREYTEFTEAVSSLKADVASIKEKQSPTAISDAIRQVLREETSALQFSWLTSTFTVLSAIAGICVVVASSPAALQIAKDNSWWIGLVLIVVSLIVTFFRSRTRKKQSA